MVCSAEGLVCPTRVEHLPLQLPMALSGTPVCKTSLLLCVPSSGSLRVGVHAAPISG